eukprot:CAMPEP_0185176394 /NCGR_PEP_ID=MMETSP1139-20130426/28283_1 /TAXON_ID=298111 /ORGANISM="Pavlova sp., Strain CCMP459" /LENGTH=269 /DNA_ID=CAMNT_0027742161 /DNA_START=285 /DNA_END=1092 /DNA_ORIENTATION=+
MTPVLSSLCAVTCGVTLVTLKVTIRSTLIAVTAAYGLRAEMKNECLRLHLGDGPVKEYGFGHAREGRCPEEVVARDSREASLHEAEHAAVDGEARSSELALSLVSGEGLGEVCLVALHPSELLGEAVCILDCLVGALPEEGWHGVRRVADEHGAPVEPTPRNKRVVQVCAELKAPLTAPRQGDEVVGQGGRAEACLHVITYVHGAPFGVDARVPVVGAHYHTLVVAAALRAPVGGRKAVGTLPKPLVELRLRPFLARAPGGDAPSDANP